MDMLRDLIIKYVNRSFIINKVYKGDLFMCITPVNRTEWSNLAIGGLPLNPGVFPLSGPPELSKLHQLKSWFCAETTEQ